MKAYKVLFIIMFSFYFAALNAQIFTGGNLNVSTNASNQDNGTLQINKSSTYNVAFSPFAGIFISERLAAGLEIDISFSGSKSLNVNETIRKSSSLGMSPFLRYYAIRLNKLAIFGQGNIGLGFDKSKTKTNAVTTEDSNATRFYLNFFPGISYDISDRFSLETSLHFLNFGYNHIVTKDGTNKYKGSSFGFSSGLSNILSIGSITIGAIYKF